MKITFYFCEKHIYMIQIFLVTLVIIALAFVGLGINIFFRKIAFPETEVGKNKDMKALGITCTKCDEMRKFRQMKKYKKVTLDIDKLSI